MVQQKFAYLMEVLENVIFCRTFKQKKDTVKIDGTSLFQMLYKIFDRQFLLLCIQHLLVDHQNNYSFIKTPTLFGLNQTKTSINKIYPS